MNIPIPAETPDPNIDNPTLPPTEPEPIPEKDPPEHEPPAVEEPPTTQPPVIVRHIASHRRAQHDKTNIPTERIGIVCT